jgi:GNAT superfamily N-acetyltransferase
MPLLEEAMTKQTLADMMENTPRVSFLDKVTFTTEITRPHIRECIKNHLYVHKDWYLYNDYQAILKYPPADWKTNEVKFIIAWYKNKPIGILTSNVYIYTFPNFESAPMREIHNNIFVRPEYRTFGIGTKLITIAIDELKIKKLRFVFSDDDNINKLAKKFPDSVYVHSLHYPFIRLKLKMST